MKTTIKLFALTFLSLFVASAAFAQVTTSSMSGKVSEKNGTTVVGATVIATHTPSGSKYYTITDDAGNYRIPNMRIGGPYELEVSLLGFGTSVTKEIYLKLGDNFVQNVTLQEEAITLDALVVSGGVENPILNSDKTGTSTNISSAQIRQLPTISRSIMDFTALTPQANGISFGGRDMRMNSVTIDGAAFNTHFGLSTSQILPGGKSQPISLDAIEEITVNLSPYDIRQSQFTGASVNAVTKSGTNTYTGSAYAYLRPKNFTGNKAGSAKVPNAHDTKTQTYGFTAGGPIIKDKLFLFVSGEYEKSTYPSGAYEPSTDGQSDAGRRISRTTVADLQQMHDYLLSTYGYEAGAFQNFGNFQTKNHKIMARLDWNINKKHKLMLRYNEVNGKYDNLTNGNSGPARRGSNRSSVQSVTFSNAWYGMKSTVRSIAAELNSQFSNKVSNSFIVTYNMSEDKRTSNSSEFPFVDIWKGGDQYMSFGYELFSYNNDLVDNTFSVKNNLQVNLGRHNLTAGIAYDSYFFKNNYMREGTTYYKYNYNNSVDPATGITYADGLAAFYAGATPTEFGVTYGYDLNSKPAVKLTVGLASLYVQDEFQAHDKLKLTFGLRAEVPFYHNNLQTNSQIDALSFNKWDNKYFIPSAGADINLNYNMRSGKWPHSRVQLSPRFGFNWDVTGDRSIQVRGGTGLFSGLLPFVWFTNQPTNSGMIQSPETLISITTAGGNQQLADAGIKFNPDWRAQIKNNPTLFPTTPGRLSASPALCEVDKDFKLPQIWRSSVAVDVELPWNMVFTLEEMYTKDINAVMQKNINLAYPTGAYKGSDNRPYWTATKLQNNVSSAMLLTNTSKGYQNSLTAQLTKNMTKGFSGSVAYTWTVAKDITANPGSTAASAWSSNPVVSYLNAPELSYSYFAVPHRVIGNLSYRFEWGGHFATTFSVVYTGAAQGRSSWTYTNDVNKDGYTSDLLYVPANKDDIKFVDFNYTWRDPATNTNYNVLVPAAAQADAFWDLVERDSYLKSRKGKYAQRYGANQPWRNNWNFKVVQDIFTNFGTNRRYTLQFSLDIINVGNLLNKNWGCYKTMGVANYANLRPLTMVGVDNGEPTYRLNASATANNPASVTDNFKQQTTWKKSAVTDSTWGMLFGVRLLF